MAASSPLEGVIFHSPFCWAIGSFQKPWLALGLTLLGQLVGKFALSLTTFNQATEPKAMVLKRVIVSSVTPLCSDTFLYNTPVFRQP